MSYYSLHLEFTAAPPFDRENWFETFVGHFVKPLLATGLVQQYWFTRYGTRQQREIRLRLTTNDFAVLKPTIEKQIQAFQFTDLADEQSATLANNLGGGRFLSPDASSQSAEHRGQLMLNIQHAIAALFVDALIGPDSAGYFRQEKNTDINNPHGSVFETVHHLLCNTTDVVTEIQAFRFGNNLLGVESPLYASELKAQLSAQGMPVSDWGVLRIHF